MSVNCVYYYLLRVHHNHKIRVRGPSIQTNHQAPSKEEAIGNSVVENSSTPYNIFLKFLAPPLGQKGWCGCCILLGCMHCWHQNDHTLISVIYLSFLPDFIRNHVIMMIKAVQNES